MDWSGTWTREHGEKVETRVTHIVIRRIFPEMDAKGRFCSVTVTTLLSVTQPASRLWSVRHTRGITLTLTFIISEKYNFCPPYEPGSPFAPK